MGAPECGGKDRGAATVWAAMAASLLVVCSLAVLAVGTAVLARHRAGAAADFGALAAAAHANAEGGGRGGDSACTWAERAVQRHGATLVACRCEGEVCEVRAAEATPWGAAAVSSRAGPGDGAAVAPNQVAPGQIDPGQVDAGQSDAAGQPQPRQVEGELGVPVGLLPLP